MSIAGLVMDFFITSMDWSSFKTGVDTVAGHRWGHLPYDEVKNTVGSHVLTSQHMAQQYGPEWQNLSTSPTDRAHEIRKSFAQHLRSNTYNQTITNCKIKSLEKKAVTPIVQERLEHLNSAQAYLGREHKQIRAAITHLEQHHPISKSQKFFDGLAGHANTARRKAYQYPVAAGVLMASALVLVPLLCVYSDLKSMSAKRRS